MKITTKLESGQVEIDIADGVGIADYLHLIIVGLLAEGFMESTIYSGMDELVSEYLDTDGEPKSAADLDTEIDLLEGMLEKARVARGDVDAGELPAKGVARDFQVGDAVKVVKKVLRWPSPKDVYDGNSWVTSMNDYLGKEGVVRNVDAHEILVECDSEDGDGVWHYHRDSLELAEPAKT